MHSEPFDARSQGASLTRLVLLPGMDGSGFFFRDFIAALRPAVEPTVMRYPVDRGLGYLELEALVRDALPCDEPFVLVGESFSGPIAIALASSYPPGLIAVVLVCTFARSPARVIRTFRHCSGDRVIPASASVFITQCLPSVRIVEIDGPHFLLQAKPAESAHAVRAFAREAGAVL